MTLRPCVTFAALLVIVACLAPAGPLAAHSLDCAHSHPGGGRTVCDDSHGDPCTTEEGEDGTCKQFTKNCLCVARSTDDPHLADAPASGSQAGEEEEGGRPVLARVRFEIDGLGSFKAGTRNTSQGHTDGLFANEAFFQLEAEPAPGMKFVRWLLNGNFSSTQRVHRALASPGLVVTAVFAPRLAPEALGSPGEEGLSSTESPTSLDPLLATREQTCSFTCFGHSCSIDCGEGKRARCGCQQKKKEPNGWQWMPYCRCS